MKFTKEAVQTEVDMAADELEKAGHTDLAEKVDYYGNRLMVATAGEVPLIRRALSRILEEARRRMGAAAQPEPSEEAKKAEHATSRTRRASDTRREVLRRRLMEIVANRKKAMEKLQTLRGARQERRDKRQERLAKDEKK
jgi:hypothetical protein